MSDAVAAPVYDVVTRETLIAEPGLDFLLGMMDMRHPWPPFSRTTGILLASAEKGRVVFEGTPSADFLNPLGTVHGGWIAAILDSAMACAVHSTLRAGQAYTTVEMKLNYVRPVSPDLGPVRCEASVIHAGATLATAEGRLFDARGRLIAHGTETCMILMAGAGGAART